MRTSLSLVTAALLIVFSTVTNPTASASLIFERAGWQTSAGAVASDPTVRPFQGNRPATISTTFEIDFQGNGRPDLIACHGTLTNLPDMKLPCRVLRPNPDGSVSEITRSMFGTGELPSMSAPKEIVAADFNGDGLLDVFIAAHGYDAAPFLGETNVLLISNPDGTYTDRSSTLPQTPDFSHSACVGDINRDGRLDIYVNNIVIPRAYSYFLVGKGDGTFTQKTTGLPPTFTQSRTEGFTSCLFLDVDRDGYDDLILGTWSVNGFGDDIILFNDRTGDFSKRPRYVLPRPLQAAILTIAAVDLNRDGRKDLVMLSETDNSFGSGLQALINQGNSTFVDETVAYFGPSSVVSTGAHCGFLRVADFNGDGWEDFYCSDGPETVPNRYWMSNGDATWSPLAENVLPPGSGLGIHAVDFDGDGRPDLLAINTTNAADIRYQSYFNRTPFATLDLSRALFRRH